MAQQHPVRLLEQSPLSLLVCSSCQRPFSSSPNSPTFRLAPCTHALCDTCLSISNTAQPPACPVCAHPGPFAPLDHALNDPDLASFFQPLSSLLSQVESAAEWQLGSLASQLEHQRGKAKMQNRLLKKAAEEMKHLRGVKDQAEQLALENASLRSQLAATSSAHSRPGPNTTNSAHAAATADGYRELRDSPGQAQSRSSLPLRASTSARAASRSDPAGLPLPPSRLSFTAEQTREQRERGRQEARAASAAGSARAERTPGPSVKERLAKFAYNPSARSAPRPSGSIATTPHPRPASSTQHQQQQQPLSLSRSASRFSPYPQPSPRLAGLVSDPNAGGWHGENAQAFAVPQDGSEPAGGGGGEGGGAGGGEENPFRFNPPGLSLEGDGGGGGGGHGAGGLSHGYSSSAVDLGAFDLAEAQGSMPPPPVPVSSRRSTGQQARQGFASARGVQGQQQAGGGHGFFGGGGGAGTPRMQTGSFAPRPASTSAATPFFPSSQLHPSSRRPFAPPHQHQPQQQFQQQTMQPQAQTPAPGRTGTANSHRTPFRPGGGG